MSFLLMPSRIKGESAEGYMHRLASENALPFRVAAAVARDVVPLSGDEPNWRKTPGPSVRSGSSRFCPECLADRPFWRQVWQVQFADACARHGCWLLDACTECKALVHWRRGRLLTCDCGYSLRSQRASAAPEAVLDLSADLAALAAGDRANRIAPLHALSLSQAVRLVRVIGGYGVVHGRMPQKILGVDRHSVSWAVTSYAAAVLSTWPLGFDRLLENQIAGTAPAAIGSLPGAFRGLYFAIYRGLREQEFNFVREAFENYLREHWTGGLCKRNRRLASTTVSDAAWISVSEAAARLGVPVKAVRRLIASRSLTAVERITRSGRRFWTVRLASPFDKRSLEGGLSVRAAARLLGLRRSRLARLLGPFGPLSRVIDPVEGQWCMDSRLLWELIETIQRAPVVSEVQPDFISLDRVLRYGALPDRDLASLIERIASGEVAALGRKPEVRGLPALILPKEAVQHDAKPLDLLHTAGFSVPAAAMRLGIKQEVAYFLVRNGFLRAMLFRGRRRPEWRVSEEQLDAFRCAYVFARDLAPDRGAAVRKVVAQLAVVGVRPCSGPGIDGGRQWLFRRLEAERADPIGRGSSIDLQLGKSHP